jgi:hypothetical protein
VTLAVIGALASLTNETSIAKAAAIGGVALAIVGLSRLGGYVAFEGDTLRDDSIPPTRIATADATAMHYRQIALGGGRAGRIGVFVVTSDTGETAVIPRYGYTRKTRRDLFAALDAWRRTAGLEIDATTADTLERAKKL